MIGKHCRVKLIPKFFNTEPRLASAKLVAKYKKYEKLHNKEVIVIAKSEKATSDAYKVYLKDEGPEYWFTLDIKYLNILAGPKTCNCPMKTLMCRGCQCGAFAREKQNPLDPPW